ncbi:hypothetical protein COCNU_scaffold004014G000010 [Cocos nucifera]|nr:hypothetical protein [Cocos nucifera]
MLTFSSLVLSSTACDGANLLPLHPGTAEPITATHALMRFDPKRLVEQRKRKLKPSNPLPMKRGKEKDVAVSSLASPRSTPTSTVAVLVINSTPAYVLPSPTSSPMSRGHQSSTGMVRPPPVEQATRQRSSSITIPPRSSLSTTPISMPARQAQSSRGSKVPMIDPPSTFANQIDLVQASMQDIPTLSKDLLYTATSYFRLFTEHVLWLFENKKTLEEGLQFLKDCQKAVEDKAAKEAKLFEGLKKQLEEKLAKIKEKNKVLLDLQRKANEGEERLLELQQEASKVPDLEAKVKGLKEVVSSQDSMLATHDKALMEAGLALVSEADTQSAPNMGSTVEAPQPTPEVPIILLHSKVEPSAPVEASSSAPAVSLAPALAEVPTIELISLEDDPTVVPAKAPQADA